jgi:hypothetical protein
MDFGKCAWASATLNGRILGDKERRREGKKERAILQGEDGNLSEKDRLWKKAYLIVDCPGWA